jgi:hypothetical protein
VAMVSRNCVKTYFINREIHLWMFHVCRLSVVSTLVLGNASDLSQLANTEARIILLYSTREEAREILAEATRLKLTGQCFIQLCSNELVCVHPCQTSSMRNICYV